MVEVDGGVVLVGEWWTSSTASTWSSWPASWWWCSWSSVDSFGFGFGFGPLPGLSVVVVVVLVVLLVVVSLSARPVPRSTEGSSIGVRVDQRRCDTCSGLDDDCAAGAALDGTGCAALDGALSHDGNPAGAELPLLVPSEKPSLSVSLFLTSNVAVP